MENIKMIASSKITLTTQEQLTKITLKTQYEVKRYPFFNITLILFGPFAKSINRYDLFCNSNGQFPFFQYSYNKYCDVLVG